MIDYYVTYKKGEKILNVNLDFNLEISNFNFKNLKSNIKNQILKLAKKLKAKKINIIVNGILISTLLITPIKTKNDYNSFTFINNNTISDTYSDNYWNIKDLISIENKINNIDNNSNNNINKTIKNIDTTNVNKNNEKIENDKGKEKIVTIYRNNGNVIKLPLDEYLIGVVGSEMPASFNIEALKAQTIVARTYTLKAIEENKKLTDTVSTQVYKDNSELKNIWKNDYDKYYNKIKNAVNDTKGLVITYNNKLIDAVYHSTSNGMTEDSIYVWNYSIPYLKSVSSEYDRNVSSYKRTIKFSYEEMSKILDTNIDSTTNFILERNESNRVTNVKINDISIKGTIFRNLLSLRSTDFEINIVNDEIVITTYGYGHGVGMSQYGANEMAKNGYNYSDIINHYYTNVKIISIP